MFRTTLRSASGPIRGHACINRTLAPQRLVGVSRCYTTPVNDNDQGSRAHAHTAESADSIEQSVTEQTSNSRSQNVTNEGPTKNNNSFRIHRGWRPKNEQSGEHGENTTIEADFDQSYTVRKIYFEKPSKVKKHPIWKEPSSSKAISSEDGGNDISGQDEQQSTTKSSRSPRVRGGADKRKKLKLTARQAGSNARDKATHTASKIIVMKKVGLEDSPEVASKHTGTVGSEDLDFKALDFETPPVPNLAFGLDRVLFNPGVYHLRDPRSRVYNFDPYLGNIMPVTEFDFNALKEYITSSKDETLIQLAREQKKKYVGSSSSMTSVLSHFHYLVSQWRPLNRSMVSQGFGEDVGNFTRLLRGPSAMFLHYKDGVYAIDADKEYDNANILMNLGKSMEKLLTLPKEEFERYRRSSPNKITPEEEQAIPESYHFSTLGDFVMRSQLDAYDPRLPGSGMFDLKTRAVVSIRMSVMNYEEGLGYEIKDRFGDWESFEREYYDMIRAAFLKYSLQVRIGRMDGVFVAFHNVERIFGFQYVPLSEMDHALHGTSDSTLGDWEFQLSIKLWNEILDKAVAKYPKQSLRLHFETVQMDTKLAKMYIFVQPVTDEQIKAIQEKNKAEIEEYQRQLLYPETITKEEEEAAAAAASESEAASENLDDDAAASGSATAEQAETDSTNTTTTGTIDSTEKDTISVLEQIEKAKEAKERQRQLSKQQKLQQEQEEADLFGMELTIRNIVNGVPVIRPRNIRSQHKWEVEYTLKEFAEDDKGGLRQIYRSMRKRRKMALEAKKKANGYTTTLRKLARKGKAYREEQDRIDQEQGVVIYEELKASPLPGPGSGSESK